MNTKIQNSANDLKPIAPRLTPYGAALLALAVALPGGALISIIAWLLGY